MGQKSAKGTVVITNSGGRIRLRWSYFGKRYSLNVSTFSKENLRRAKTLIKEIEKDIVLKTFDTTLFKYTGKEKSPPVQLQFWQHYEVWVSTYLNMDCDKHVNYYAFRNMIKKWGEVNESNILNKFNSQTFCATTYNRRLKMLKDFVQWLNKRGLWTENPVLDVRPKRVQKTEKSKRKPFTEDEIKRILNAFKTDIFCKKKSAYRHSFYYPFIYFLFKTGVRNAEAIGLRVSKIDFEKNTICIDEVMASSFKGKSSKYRVRKETKNGKIRFLPLNDDLKEVLLPVIKDKESDDLVFTTERGFPIDDLNFQRRTFKPILKNLGIEERVLYACRHTFGSRCIDQGITPVMTAFLMGNNPETALRNYTHQMSLPKDLPNIT